METNELSGLRFYSVGRVAANKKRGSYLIEVVPVEQLPNLSQEITDHTTKVSAKIAAVEGSDAKDIEIDSTVSQQAVWLPLGGTNRFTAPDVRRGEYVILMKFGDAPVIYWMELKAAHVLRRLETVTWIFSNEREENKPLTEDNTYSATISTHDKHITINTTKSDGEPFAYRLQLNTKEGFFTLEDDDGNYIFMNSKDRHIKLRNKDDSFVEMNKRIINISSADEINLKTRKYTLNASDSITEQTRTHQYSSSTTSMEVSGAYKIQAGSWTATSVFKLIGATTIVGNTRVEGSASVTRDHSVGGKSSGPNNNF